jgi:hypothetical protein
MALELSTDLESLTHPSPPIADEKVVETEQAENNLSTAPPEQPTRKSLAFLDDDPEEPPTLLGKMEQAAAQEAPTSPDDPPSAILAESQTDAIRTMPHTFEEEPLLATMLPEKAQVAHARTLTEEEVHIFVNGIVRAAGIHHRKLNELLELSKPYILRDREFYNRQGQRNSQDKTWTTRKKELAEIYGVSLRTFERAFSEIVGKLISYTLNIPGLIDGLEVKVPKDCLSQLQLLEDRARSSSALAEPAEQEEIKSVASPVELWQLIDHKLTDSVDDVFHVSEADEFAARLQLFAQTIAKSFFPELVVEIKLGPCQGPEESQ